MSPPVANRIKDGIEFFDGPEGREECQCARCGSSTAFIDCAECGGDGYVNRIVERDPVAHLVAFDRCVARAGPGFFGRCRRGVDPAKL